LDLLGNNADLLEAIRRVVPSLPPHLDLFEIADNPTTHRDLAVSLLLKIREHQIAESSLWAIEALMSHDEFSLAAEEADLLEYFGDAPSWRFDRGGLARLSENEFQAVAARFSVALADALSPDAQSKSIVASADKRHMSGRSQLAYRALSEPMSHDYIFDRAASVRITTALEHAHSQVLDLLESNRFRTTLDHVAPGKLREADSETVLGVQVADLAAGVAAPHYERFGLEGREAAKHLRLAFERVFYNRDWL